jgi:hypothetical protein
MPISLRLLLESEFPDEKELAAMKDVMDGGKPTKHVASGMKKQGLKNIRDLVLWGLKTGIIRDEPKTELQKYQMDDPKKAYEAHPMWLQYLGALAGGYDPDIPKSTQEFLHKKIAIAFHLHPSIARLIRFAFQVISPVQPPKKAEREFRPWTKSTTSLMRIPQTMTGSKIDPEGSITKETMASAAMALLGLDKLPKSTSKKGGFWNRPHNQLWHLLEMAKERRDAEIKRLHPIANRHPENPDQEKQVKLAARQLAVVNAAWDRIRILFARNGYALPGDEELLSREKRQVYIPGR